MHAGKSTGMPCSTTSLMCRMQCQHAGHAFTIEGMHGQSHYLLSDSQASAAPDSKALPAVLPGPPGCFAQGVPVRACSKLGRQSRYSLGLQAGRVEQIGTKTINVAEHYQYYTC